MSEKARSTGELGTGPRWAALGATLVFTLLPFAFAASACATNPVGSGTTTLHLSPAFSKSLKKGKVKLSATSPATLKGTTLALPLSGGALDSDSGQGAISQSGELKLKAPHGRLFLKSFTLKTTRSPLIANVSGAQLQLTSAPKPRLAREGFGFQIRYPTLKLSKNLAERLEQEAPPEEDLLHRGGAGLPADQGPAADDRGGAHGRRGARIQPRDLRQAEQPRRRDQPGLPRRTHRQRLPPADPRRPDRPRRLAGNDRNPGHGRTDQTRLRLVQLREIWPEFGPKTVSAELAIEPASPVTGGLARPSIGTLSLSGASVTPNPTARTVGVSGATVDFTQVTAETFNEAFAKGEGKVFNAGEALGTVSFVGKGE